MKFWMNSKLINITIKKWWTQFVHKKIKKVALDNDNKKIKAFNFKKYIWIWNTLDNDIEYIFEVHVEYPK